MKKTLYILYYILILLFTIYVDDFNGLILINASILVVFFALNHE